MPINSLLSGEAMAESDKARCLLRFGFFGHAAAMLSDAGSQVPIGLHSFAMRLHDGSVRGLVE
jgi:hypothetical protein